MRFVKRTLSLENSLCLRTKNWLTLVVSESSGVAFSSLARPSTSSWARPSLVKNLTNSRELPHDHTYLRSHHSSGQVLLMMLMTFIFPWLCVYMSLCLVPLLFFPPSTNLSIKFFFFLTLSPRGQEWPSQSPLSPIAMYVIGHYEPSPSCFFYFRNNSNS